jgi:hypothetical protein
MQNFTPIFPNWIRIYGKREKETKKDNLFKTNA